MRINELDWTNGVKYKDRRNDIWTVDFDELVNENKIDIYYAYTIKEIANMEFIKIE